MSGREVTVRHEGDLGTVYQAYLEAVDDGASELTVNLPAGALGFEVADAPPTLALAASTASGVPPLDIAVRTPDGPCVLVGLPVRIAGRRVRLEAVTVVGGPPTALAVSADESVELEGVAVLGSPADERTGAVVHLQAARAGGGIAATVRDLVVGHSTGRTAMVSCSCVEGGWFDRLAFTGLAVSGRDADAVLAVDSVAALHLNASALALGSSRVLLRAFVMPTVTEIADSRLSAGAEHLLQVLHEFPDRPGEVRLTEGAAVTVPLAELPAPLRADDSVTELAGATVDEEIDAAVRRAAERAVAVDGRVRSRLTGLYA